MTILDLSRTTGLPEGISNYAPFTWSIIVGPYTVTDPPIAGLDDPSRSAVLILSVTDSNGYQYLEVDSADDCADQIGSFFWNNATQTLYVHTEHNQYGPSLIFFSGVSQGFSDRDVVYIDNQLYMPLISNAPSFAQQQDYENDPEFTFIVSSVSLNNRNGVLDDLITRPVYGNIAQVSYLPDGKTNYVASEKQPLGQFFVDEPSIGTREVVLKLQDTRQSQNITIPRDRFSSDTYTDLSDDLENEVIPVLWGQAREIPAICVNSTVTTGNVKYRAALLLDSLGTVQVDVDGIWTTRTAVNVDLATGYFELSAANGRGSSGAPLACKLVDPDGIPIVYLSDIMIDCNQRYLNIPYNASNYRISEWEAEEVYLAGGGYYLKSEIKMYELFAEIQAGANRTFRYEISPRGLRTIRVDRSRNPLYSVYAEEIQNRDNIVVTSNVKNLAAEVLVEYASSYVEDTYLSLFDDSQASTIEREYNQRPKLGVQTALRSAIDAQERLDYIKNKFANPILETTLELMGHRHLALRLGDEINVELTPSEFIDRDAGNYGLRPFYGFKRVVITAIDPDPSRLSNRVKAVIISDAAVVEQFYFESGGEIVIAGLNLNDRLVVN